MARMTKLHRRCAYCGELIDLESIVCRTHRDLLVLDPCRPPRPTRAAAGAPATSRERRVRAEA